MKDSEIHEISKGSLIPTYYSKRNSDLPAINLPLIVGKGGLVCLIIMLCFVAKDEVKRYHCDRCVVKASST